jgi:hypothetical protein
LARRIERIDPGALSRLGRIELRTPASMATFARQPR